jgi:hypothetical protein
MGIRLPAASLACSVARTLDPEATVDDAMVMTEVAKDKEPGVTTIEGRTVVIGDPLRVASRVVPVPTRTPVKLEV